MRLFIAVTVPESVQRQLASLTGRLRKAAIRGSWVRSENLHLTLKFLGETDSSAVPALEQALASCCRQFDPFQLRLTKLSFLPPRGQPRVLMVATDQERRLRRLASTLDQSLVRLGYPAAERFKAHITLARIKGPQNLMLLHKLMERAVLGQSFPVCGISLIKSELGTEGAHYQVLQQVAFSGMGQGFPDEQQADRGGGPS